MQQAREVAMAGLQPVEGVWVPLWQLAPVREGHGVLWGSVWYVAATALGPVVQCGGSCSSQIPRHGSVATVLWQQTVGTVEGIRRDNRGGLSVTLRSIYR